MKKFGYWRDPLFLTTCSLYALNRWWLKPHLHSPFFRGYFNDCLMIPCALPLVLWLQRQSGLRKHDDPPSAAEVFWHLALWSALCEWAGPHLMRTTGDAWDVVAYAVGGLLAWAWWRRPARSGPAHEL